MRGGGNALDELVGAMFPPNLFNGSIKKQIRLKV